jgi:O-antigen/teichoic acid export membrane protein
VSVFNPIFVARGAWHPALTVVALVLATMLLVAIVFWLIGQRNRAHPRGRLWERVASRGVAVAVVGLIVLGVRYQRALYLSSPLVLLGWLAGFFWWFGDALYRTFKIYPREREEYLQAERRARWLKKRR